MGFVYYKYLIKIYVSKDVFDWEEFKEFVERCGFFVEESDEEIVIIMIKVFYFFRKFEEYMGKGIREEIVFGLFVFIVEMNGEFFVEEIVSIVFKIFMRKSDRFINEFYKLVD